MYTMGDGSAALEKNMGKKGQKGTRAATAPAGGPQNKRKCQ
jgi:hypothetical protein